MKQINKFDITNNLILNFVDSLLMEQSKEFIIAFAPKYNYITNTLVGMNFRERGDITLLKNFVELFKLSEDYLDEEFYTNWKEGLYNTWMEGNENKLMKTTHNGVISYHYLESVEEEGNNES